MNTLLVTNVSETQEAIDGRQYKVITVVPESSNGAISTASPHKRTIWNRQPMEGEFNPYFDKIRKGSKIVGKIQTLETKPYFIPSENGADVDENGNPANRATQKTYVVFEDETAVGLRTREGLDPTDDSGEQETAHQISPVVSEETSEELEEEAEPAVS